MNTLLWMSLIVAALLFTGWFHLWLLPRLFKHPPPKGFHMDNDEDTDSGTGSAPARPISSGSLPQRAGGPVFRASDLPGGNQPRPLVASASEPIERSVNDVMDLRKQCEYLAKLTKQYENGASSPWSLVTVDLTDAEHAAFSAFGYDICLWSWALQKLMQPIAAAAEQRAVSALGNLWYIDVAANKLWFDEHESMVATHKALNEDYFRLVKPLHESYLLALKRAARLPKASTIKHVQVLKCGQTLVYVPEDVDGNDMLRQLNASYAHHAQPVLDGILSEIEDWIERG